MNITSIGDLAQSLMLRNRSQEIRQSISTLTQELSSGQVNDVSDRLGGDYSYLTDIDRNLARLGGFSVSASEAAFFADASQNSLGRLHDLSSSLSSSLISLNPYSLEPVRNNLGQQAVNDIETAISALNTTIGGRSLFGGTATDRVPLASADVLMTELQSLVSGLGSAAAVQAAVDIWFDDPAGFTSVMYNGADQTLAPIQIGPGQEVSLTLKADDATFRDTLKNMAFVALAGDPTMGFDRATQSDLFMAAGAGLLSSQDQLAGVRADVGFAQARIEEAQIRNASARTGLEYTRGALLAADPFETATRLEEAQFQLESLYTVTVRSSQLSLLNFMR
ncbi:flagellin [Sedimentitalea nanhaiensis]|uniref:Flagellar hook-associated protein 3 FlgL n=1 Tax=Sedimentitalea nanhaiensis TaxID=999627 RepID=A0A1I6Z333_9RHOB|nr:flagellin [Sedimentitalea nanhaiensis]SFT57127.1 flagellar hook-associated protein 3 FlgL [Sedimentitalea nanhaiensis]